MKERAREPAPSLNRWWELLADDLRRLDLAGDDLGLHLVDLDQPGLRNLGLRADLPEGDAFVLQVEDEVAAALVPLATLRSLDCEEDPGVHPLHSAREDVVAEVRLVDVDADAPASGLLGRVQSTEAARTGHGEDHLRASVDLVLGDALALRLIDEVLRVADPDRCPRDALERPCLVAGEERVYRRDLEAAHRTDVLATSPRSYFRRKAADEVAVLLGGVRQAFDVRVLPLEGFDPLIGDRELRVRELICHVLGRIRQQEASRDDDVVATSCQRGHVRQVITRRPGLDRSVRDLQDPRRPLHSGQLVLVEALVVETADVTDQPGLERGLGRRSTAGHKTHRREYHGNEPCQAKRQHSMLLQKTLLLLETHLFIRGDATACRPRSSL